MTFPLEKAITLEDEHFIKLFFQFPLGSLGIFLFYFCFIFFCAVNYLHFFILIWLFNLYFGDWTQSLMYVKHTFDT